MKDFIIKVRVKASGQDDAALTREEIAMALEDARDSGELPAEVTFDVEDAVPVESPMHREVIDVARNRHAIGSDDEIEIDDDAIVNVSPDGCFVQAWVWVPMAEPGSAEDQ